MRIFKNKPWNLIRKHLQSGVGIAEVMVSVAVLGIVIVGLISQQRLSVKSSQGNYSDNEINNITKKVTSEIGVQSICSLTENLGGKVPGASLTRLQRAAGAATAANTILAVNGEYGQGQGQVLVSNIETRANGPNELILILSFRKKESGIVGKFMARTVKREIPLSVVIVSGTIAACYGNYDLIIKTAVELACLGSGAVYDPNANLPYGTCTRQSTPALACPAGQVLTKVDPTTSKVTGVDYTCKGLAQACTDPDEIVIGFNTDGTPKCGMAYKPCNAGEVLVKNSSGVLVCTQINCEADYPITAFNGFSASGGQICRQIPGPTTCGGTNFASQLNTDGSVSCNTAYVQAGGCAPGEFIQGINSAGAINCVKWINLPAWCGAGTAIDGVDANGNVTCKTIRRALACDGTQNNHSYNDCRNSGGSIYGAGGGNSHCIFSGASCPGGWNRCYSFGSQVDNSCLDTSNTYYCDGNRSWRTAYAPGGNWAYNNSGQPSATCYQWTGFPNTSYACYAYAVQTIYTTQTQVGCY